MNPVQQQRVVVTNRVIDFTIEMVPGESNEAGPCWVDGKFLHRVVIKEIKSGGYAIVEVVDHPQNCRTRLSTHLILSGGYKRSGQFYHYEFVK